MLGSEKTNFALCLIGFRTGGGAAVGAQIFVEIPGRQNKKEAFSSGRRCLAFWAKQQRSPKRLKLSWIFLGNRWTAPTPAGLWSGTHRKRRHWHSIILAKGYGSVKIFHAIGRLHVNPLLPSPFRKFLGNDDLPAFIK